MKPTKGTGKYGWDGARAFSSLTVLNNATLTIPSVATSGNYIPLVTESLTLGPGATLNVSAGEGNGVYAANWSIDPTAHINVTVLDTFTTGATPILVDTGSDALADFTGRITLSGATSGAVLKRAGGNIVLVKKTVTEADGTYQYEWVSSSSSYKWRNTGSWYCKAAPPTSGTRYPIVFGAVDKYTTSNYNMTDTTPTIVQLVFRDTAVSSFTVANDATKPLSFQKYSASDSGTANASIYSLSAVPQYINCNARTTSNNRFSLYAADSGPVVFGGGIEAAGAKAQTEAAVHVCGDIRTTGTISHRMLAFTKRPAKPDMSRLFVESGTVAFTNQVAAFDVTNAGFRVATGATLAFDGRLASAFYQWTAVPQKIVGIIASLRPSGEEAPIKDALHRPENLLMHDKILNRLIDTVVPLLTEAAEEGIRNGIFSCDHVPERVRMLLVISNNLFNEGHYTEGDIAVFIDLMEKMLGAAPGTMAFIRALIQ